jgi:type I restriction enzyme S subunit
MTPQDLIARFDEISEAPGGVDHLRALVLRLAATGGLSAPRPGDDHASDCLLHIREDRLRLIADGTIRNPRPLKIEDNNQPPVEIPDAWTWARLDDVSAWPLTDGDWVESKDQDPRGDVRLVQLADVGVGEFKDKSDRHLTSATALRLGCTFLSEGDVLIARLPSPIGRACIFPGSKGPCVTVVDVAIARLGGSIDARYFTLAMNSDVLRIQVESYGKGATRFRVATGHLRQLWFPVPPLAEQKRIVVRVAELMKLIGQLETAQTVRDSLHGTFASAAVHHLDT